MIKCDLIKWDAYGNYKALEFLKSKEICEQTKKKYELENPVRNNEYYILEIVENVEDY